MLNKDAGGVAAANDRQNRRPPARGTVPGRPATKHVILFLAANPAGTDPLGLDLEEILRVLPYWARDRYLELAPKYWRATRGRLRPEELATPISAFEVPPRTRAPNIRRRAP